MHLIMRLRRVYLCLALTLFFSESSFSMVDSSLYPPYTFQFQGINSKPIYLSSFQGKVLLVVNTACLCGFTPQLAGLQYLHKTYHKDGLVVIAVPSNDFGNQEPWTIGQIVDFAQDKYSIDFLMTQKEHVIGPEAHPFYQWAAPQVSFLGRPKWNFHKYLIDREGKLIDWFLPTTAPTSPRMLNAIETALGLFHQ